MNLARLRQAWKRRIWLSILRRYHPEIEVQVGNRRMRVDLRDHVIGRNLYVAGEYEPELQRLMRNMDLRGCVCLDIGANIGVHTVAMSEFVGSSGKVFSFEPESQNYRLLEFNLRINKAANVITRRSAVGDTERICRLMINPNNYGDHRVWTGGPATGAFQEVPMTTIDASLRELPDDVVRFIKIDVQGYECQVVRGMTVTLERNPNAIMMIEVFPDGLCAAGMSATELMQFLHTLGLVGWELQVDRILPVSEPWVYDHIRNGRHVDVVLSRNAERLRMALSNMYGRPLPRNSPLEISARTDRVGNI